MGQKVAAYNSSGNIIGLFDSSVSTPPDGIETVELTTSQWQQIMENSAGWVVQDGAVVAASPLPVAQQLAAAQAAQISSVNAAYRAAIEQPVSFKTAAGVTEEFDADESSQTVLVKVTQGYVLAGTVPSDFYWVAADNTKVSFALTDLQGLYQAMLAQGWGAFQKLQTLKSEIAAATTVSAVQAINW